MPAGHPQFPAISWSHGRDQTLRRCQRMYYWRYYGGHGGWHTDADPTTRMAWTLKQLTTLSGALGQEIHARATEITDALRNGEEIPSLDDLTKRTRAALNRLWRASGEREKFLRRPKHHPMLLERYRHLEPSNDRLVRLREKLHRCIRHLRTSPIWDEVRCAEEVIRWEPIDATEYMGTAVYAPTDLVYRIERGQPYIIVDWKTGADDPEVVMQQLAVYGLVLRERFGFAPPFRGLIVDLDSNAVRSHELCESVIATAERRIRNSLYEMRRYVVDLDLQRNEAKSPEVFELRIDTSNCHWCPYYEFCSADLDEATYSGPF